MAELSDKEITEACARAMGLRTFGENNSLFPKAILVTEPSLHVYAPLDDRAQAMELVEKLRLDVLGANPDEWLVAAPKKLGNIGGFSSDLLRAICLCAARVQIEKEKNA